jgi:hypothetical protein
MRSCRRQNQRVHHNNAVSCIIDNTLCCQLNFPDLLVAIDNYFIALASALAVSQRNIISSTVYQEHILSHLPFFLCCIA